MCWCGALIGGATDRPTKWTRTTDAWPASNDGAGRELLSELAGGDALEQVDQPRDGDGGREVHQQMEVAAVAVELGQFRAEARTRVPHDLLQAGQVGLDKHRVTVLGD